MIWGKSLSLKVPETQISKIILPQRLLLKNRQLWEGVGCTYWLTLSPQRLEQCLAHSSSSQATYFRPALPYFE